VEDLTAEWESGTGLQSVLGFVAEVGFMTKGGTDMNVEVFDARTCALGEGPAWDAARSRVWWVDITGHRVLWRSVADDSAGEFPVGDLVGAVIVGADGQLTLCLRNGLAVLDPDTGAVSPDLQLPGSHVKSDIPLRMNDAKVAPDGSLFAGTMFIENDGDVAGKSALYRIRGVDISVVASNVTLSNGLGWSPDGSLMYYVDTMTGRIDCFDVEPDGAPVNRRVFVDLGEPSVNPDGLSVDSEGGVWLAVWGGSQVRRYDNGGALTEVIDVPTSQVSSCAFVGEDMSTLVITTAAIGLSAESTRGAGLTYQCRPGVSGVPVTLL